MQINVKEISLEYLEKLEEQITSDIQNKKSIDYITFDLSYFENMTVDEIINILNQSEMPNVDIIASNIFSFFQMEKRKFSNVDFFVNSRNEIRQLITDILNEFNDKMLEKKQKLEENIADLENGLDFVRMLLSIYDVRSTDVDLEIVQNSILNSNLQDEEKFILSVSIVNILIKKQTEAIILEVNEFEKQRECVITENTDAMNLSYTEELVENTEDKLLENSIVKEYFIKYNDIFNEFGIFSIDDLVDFYGEDFSIGEMLDADTIEKTDLFMFLNSVLDKINKSDSELSVEKYKMYLEKIDYKFNYWNKEFYEKRIEEINKFIETLLVEVRNLSRGNVDYNLLFEIQEQILENDKLIKENILSNSRFEKLMADLKVLENKINEFKKPKQLLDVEEKNSTPIKGFVLFDYFNEDEKIPYVLNDLNYKSGNNLIDKVLNGKERKEAYKDFNNLIFDLIKLGESRYIASSNSSIGDNASRIVNRIYYENDNTKFTGMLRIRARRNSDLRFCEQTITFVKGTEAFDQVEEILKKYLPNIKIELDNSGEFQVYVNYASAMKRSDDGLYDVAIYRRDVRRSKLVEKFIQKFKGKTKLNAEECKLFDEMVQLSLSTFDELRKQNDNFDFEIIDQLVGGIKHNEK